jgi:hypothetical protein
MVSSSSLNRDSSPLCAVLRPVMALTLERESPVWISRGRRDIFSGRVGSTSLRYRKKDNQTELAGNLQPRRHPPCASGS